MTSEEKLLISERAMRAYLPTDRLSNDTDFTKGLSQATIDVFELLEENKRLEQNWDKMFKAKNHWYEMYENAAEIADYFCQEYRSLREASNNEN